MAEIDWNETILRIDLEDIQAGVLHELVESVAITARAIAPLRIRHTPVPPARPGRRHRMRPGQPGHLKESVTTAIGEDADGMYGDVIALWYGRFMEPKAAQMRFVRPFLPTALFLNIARFESGAIRNPLTGQYMSPYL